jgi:predicted nuclease of restriction endonuclease-like (RecB) superfamily
MLSFYREYKELAISPPVMAKLAASSISPPLVAKFTSEVLLSIPWIHHITLIEKIKDLKTRHWYMQSIIDFGWSRNVLVMQIETKAHERQGKAVSNFAQRLPKHDSDLVQQTLKDPYIFDFLTLTEPFHERELEVGLILHLEKFLLELGQGFAFVGRQYHLDIGEQDFYIDLLFYHLKLRCYVVIELKRGAFIPEYVGKVNFYCNVVDDKLRHTSDKPTIGLILCQTANNITAEYTLRGFEKPIGVSSYEFARALPQELASSLPSIEAIERELAKAA